MYRCFRAELLMPGANVIKSPTHTSPWTDGDTAAAVYFCPAVVVSLLRSAVWQAGTVYQTGQLMGHVQGHGHWADEGEGEREAVG